MSLFLFLCLVAPVAITFLFIQNHKHKVKREIKWKFIAAMNHSELVKLKFTEQQKTTQLSWHHSKEFEYKGQMYDVVKSELHGDTTYYWCWWDHEETKLNKQLNELVAVVLGDSPKNEESKTRLFKFLESLYFSEYSISEFFVASGVNSTHFYSQNFYQSILLSHPFPPPEIV